MYLLDYYVIFIFILGFYFGVYILARFFPNNKFFDSCGKLLHKILSIRIFNSLIESFSASVKNKFLESFRRRFRLNEKKTHIQVLEKNKKSKSLRIEIGILYSLMALVNILFLAVMIFENQTELLVKNFKYQSENFVSTVMSDLGSKKISKDDDANLRGLKENLIYHEIFQFRIFDLTGSIWYDEKGIVSTEIIEEDLLKKAKEISDTGSIFSSKYKLELNKEDFTIKFLIPLLAEPEWAGPIFLSTQLNIRSIQERLTKLYYQIAIAFVWGVVLHILFGIYIFRTIFTRVTILKDATTKIGTSDLKSRAVWKYNRNDELDELGNSFNLMADSIETKIKTISDLHDAIHNELLVGKTIQGVLIPPQEISFGWADIYGISKSSSDLGGDYFKVYTRDSKPNEFSIALGDVSGHGVGSALVVSSVIAITSQVGLAAKDTSKSVTKINEQMSSLFKFERKSKIKYFTTSLFCNLKKKRNSVSFLFTNAGHLSPLLIRNGKCNELISTNSGLALGVHSKAQYFEEFIELEKDDILILYTDGLIEQMDTNGNQFGIERLMKTLSIKRILTTKSIVDHILNKVKKFSGGLPNEDDITLVVIKILPSVKKVKQPVGKKKSNNNHVATNKE